MGEPIPAKGKIHKDLPFSLILIRLKEFLFLDITRETRDFWWFFLCISDSQKSEFWTGPHNTKGCQRSKVKICISWKKGEGFQLRGFVKAQNAEFFS